MTTCYTPDCGGIAVKSYRDKTGIMRPMCKYCAGDQYDPSHEPPRTAPSAITFSRNWHLSGSLANLDFTANTPFFDTVLHGLDGGLESIWNGRRAYHRTQSGQNFVVVYNREQNSDITIIGYGNHVGNSNKKYSIHYDDNRRVTCERK